MALHGNMILHENKPILHENENIQNNNIFNLDQSIRKMFLIYADESGTVDINDSENFVIAGVILNEDRWFEVNSRLNELSKKYNLNNDYNFEFHLCDLVHRKDNFSKLELDERINIINSLAEIIHNTEIRVVYSIIKKKKLLTNINMRYWAYKFLFERLCYQLNDLNTFRERKGYGLLLLDSVSKKEDRKVWEILSDLLKDGSGYEENKFLIEGPIFVESHLRALSQIADFSAYLINYNFKENKNKDEKIHKCLSEAYSKISQKMVGEKKYYGKIFPN